MGKDKTHVNVVGESLLVPIIAPAADELTPYLGASGLISHRSRRFRKIDYHWSLDLQVRWY